MLDADTRQALAGLPEALAEALDAVEEDATSADLLDGEPAELTRSPSDDDESRRAAIAAMGGE